MPTRVGNGRGSCAPLDHRVGVGLGQGSAGELAGRAAVGLEQERLRLVGKPRAVDGRPYHKISTVQAWLQAQERTPVPGQSGRVTGRNEIAIVLMASCGPDLETFVRRGDAALNPHLETLESRIFAGREVRCIGTRSREKAWTVEVLNAQVPLDLEVGLTALAVQELGQPLRM